MDCLAVIKHASSVWKLLVHILASLTLASNSCKFWMATWTIFGLLPMVRASPMENEFPSLSFKMFNQFIEQNFSSKISLATVLVLLFTLTENPDLLNLHARQQNPKCEGETCTAASGWIKSLARVLRDTLGQDHTKMFKKSENYSQMSGDQIISTISMKLDAFSKKLGLHSYDQNGAYKGNLKPVSHQSIEPIHMICPNAVECETVGCHCRSLLQITKARDIPKVTLIKGSKIFENAYVLTGKCPTCQTIYVADHERASNGDEETTHSRVYINAAKYVKVGQSLWVDRIFSHGVVNGIYSFHASAAAYAEYWSNTFCLVNKRITRRQVWQAFVQESVRFIAAVSDTDLVLRDGLAIDEVTQQAFEKLGEKGIIKTAPEHACPECTQKYRATTDVISVDDPAAVVGMDEHQAVPPLIGVNSMSTGQNTQNTQHQQSSIPEDQRDPDDESFVTMAVLDGIVFGPSVCCYHFKKKAISDCFLALCYGKLYR
jgi:hypothetical protein